MKRNYLNRGDVVKMKDGRVLTVKSLDFRKFIAEEEIGYQKKNEIVDILEPVTAKTEQETINKWVSIKEEFPTETCLLLTASKMIIIGEWYDGVWRANGANGWKDGKLTSIYSKDDITHWMKLPDIQPVQQETNEQSKRVSAEEVLESVYMEEYVYSFPNDIALNRAISITKKSEDWSIAIKAMHRFASQHPIEQELSPDLSPDQIADEGIKYLQDKYPDKEILQLPDVKEGSEFMDFAMGLQIGYALCEKKHPIEQEKPSEQSAFMQSRDLTDEEWLKLPKEEILQLYKNCYKMLKDQISYSNNQVPFASQKHPVTDDMISAKLDTVNFETSRERETAFDLLVWLRDLTGRKHIPDVKKFSDRLDQIFEQGNPTKAQIIDAFNKFSGQKHLPTDEAVKAEAKRLAEREDSHHIKHIDEDYYEGFVDCAKWMREQIK